MQHWLVRRGLPSVAVVLIVFAMTASSWGQETRGRVNVTVLDPQGAVIPGADLELVDLRTGEVRTGVTGDTGTFTFVNLPTGTYRLKISMPGFRETTYDQVTVSATKVTDITARLELGALTETVLVESATPILETSDVTIGSVIDLKEIEGLPLQGRDISELATIVPGYTGTWNGLPSIAQGNNVDGVIGSPSRMKFAGNWSPAVEVRLENIEEMTVQTDQIDMNQGFGMAVMQSNFVTKRGTNEWHGQLFWDHRNDNLNANSWGNNTRGVAKGEFKLNEFGGNVGGPIIRNKLFFFFSLSTARQPGSSTRTATFLTQGAQNGDFTYVGTDGNTHTVNIFEVARNYDPSLPGSANPVIAQQLQRINSAVGAGNVNPTTNPIINEVSWLQSDPWIRWFPTLRVDYTPTENLRFNLAVNWTKDDRPYQNPAFFPGDEFANTSSGRFTNNATNAIGIEWTQSPTIVHSFRFGFLYNATKWDPNADPSYKTVAERVYWPLVTTPMDFRVPITTYYPTFNLGHTVSWILGGHSLDFGFTAYREQDHYWNPPELTNISLGLAQGDPALDALTNTGDYQPFPYASIDQLNQAQSLYALLTGRITDFSGSYPYDPATGDYIQQRALAFNLNEVHKGGGLFFQDSWRIRPNFTINYGLRWDFTAPSRDKNGAYHNADVESLWGPSGIGNLFKPGVLTGTMNPVLEERPTSWKSWYVTPQPNIGFAWRPQFDDGILRTLLGGEDTVIRTSFSLRRFTPPYQYFWNSASNYGSFFYQFYTATAREGVTGPGSFEPGSIAVGDPYPEFILLPEKYMKVAPMKLFTFNNSQYNNGSNGFDPEIGQPYTMSWTFGIQRKLGESRVLEIRYNGNRTLKQWIQLDLNEVNVFENGFLQEFLNAQKNLEINGGTSFANLNPDAGTVPLPILTAAFTGSQDGAQTDPNFSSGSFITYLNTGAVGAFASTLTRLPYFCNLVGSSFEPCLTNAGYTGPGGGYPINFFQVNPFASGIPSNMMSASGWSNYHALQVELRQQYWKGMQFNANYTWSKTLGVTTPNDWTGSYYARTLRNLRESYGPTRFDVRHVFNLYGTFELPFGSGKKWLNEGGVLDKVFGGWQVGTILTVRSGYPFRMLGGYSTFNNIGDGGVVLNGVSRDDLQDAIGVYKTGGTYVELIDPKFRTPGVGANPDYIRAHTTPGTFAGSIWLYGPGGFDWDLSLTKSIPVREPYKLTFQAQFLNVLNHPVFGNAPNPVGANVRQSWWATTSGQSNDPRVIEFRLNFSF
ncbi:MAG: hypothetical protein Kow00109_19090 [Acidobacteriota bacterium]